MYARAKKRGEDRGGDAEKRVHVGRGRQGQPDEQRGQGVAGVAEDGVIAGQIALRDEDDQDVAEDEDGVESLEKRRGWRRPGPAG